MRSRRTLSGVLILGLLLVLSIGPGLAQGPEEEAPLAPDLAIEAVVSSKFSYQGVLKEGGGLVNGSRDMVFRLYADDACTSQVGGDIAKPGVLVADGLFSVEVEVDQSYFNGQGLWLEVEVDGAAIACQEILPVPYALSLRPGAVISGTGTALSVYSSDKYALWAQTASTGDYFTAIRGRAVGTTGRTRGVFGGSDSDQGIGVLGQANAESGITYGVYGQSSSSTDLARGVYGLASATNGDTYGVYGRSDSTDGGSGGYFTGFTGVFGLGTGVFGSGGYFESTQHDGVSVGSAGDDGVYVNSAGGDGVYVYEADGAGVHVHSAGSSGVYVYGADGNGVYVDSAGGDGVYVGMAEDGVDVYWADDDGVYVDHAGGDGVYVYGADGDGVYANTTQTNHEWGFYTPDKLYVGTTLVSGGPLMFVAQNGEAGALEPGDVVVAAGLGQPLAASPSPITLVRRADAASSQAVAGVVYRRFVVQEEVEEVEHEGQVERRTHFDTHTTEGAIAPGEYLLLCVLGPCQVKVDATRGSVRPGDVLAVSNAQGCAARSQPLTVEGVRFYPPGATFGTALEPLEQGAGLIYVLVTLR